MYIGFNSESGIDLDVYIVCKTTWLTRSEQNNYEDIGNGKYMIRVCPTRTGGSKTGLPIVFDTVFVY